MSPSLADAVEEVVSVATAWAGDTEYITPERDEAARLLQPHEGRIYDRPALDREDGRPAQRTGRRDAQVSLRVIWPALSVRSR